MCINVSHCFAITPLHFISVHDALKHFHIRLLRKAKRQVKPDLWEKALITFSRPICKQDAWELERFGYKQADLGVKLRVLKVGRS